MTACYRNAVLYSCPYHCNSISNPTHNIQMHHEFRGSLRKILCEEGPHAFNPRQLPQTTNYHQTRYDHMNHTERSEYSTLNKLSTASNFEREGPLRQMYTQNIPVKISSPERSEYQVILRVEMQVINDKSNSAIRINLTDDDNPVFLWCFYLREGEYMQFKNQQKLKVDYSGFPNSLIKMLNLLLDDQKEPSMYVCAFQIQKGGGKGSLKLFESNEVKYNLNLQLKFKQATDEQSKMYLAQKLMRSVQTNQELGIKIGTQRQSIQEMMAKIEQLTLLNKNHFEEKKRELGSRENEYKSELNNLISEQLAKEDKLKREMQTRHKSLIEKHESEQSRLSKKYSELQQRCEEVTSSNQDLQNRNRELRRQNTLISSQLNDIKKNYSDTKEQLRRQQQYKIKQERTNVEFQCRIEALTRQLQDKEVIIENTQQLKTNQNSQVQALESTVSNLKKELQNKDKLMREKMDEFTRLKEGLDGQVRESQLMKTRLKQKSSVIKKQESMIKELKEKDTSSSKTLCDLERAKEKLEQDVKTLKSEKANLVSNLQEAKMRVQQSDNMIKHLHKQLTERGMGGPKIGPPSSIVQSAYRTSFNYDVPSSMTKSNLGPSIPMPSGQRLQPEIKKYLGSSQLQIPSIKTQNTNALNQEQQPEQLREHTLRVNAVKYRSPSQNGS